MPPGASRRSCVATSPGSLGLPAVAPDTKVTSGCKAPWSMVGLSFGARASRRLTLLAWVVLLRASSAMPQGLPHGLVQENWRPTPVGVATWQPRAALRTPDLWCSKSSVAVPTLDGKALPATGMASQSTSSATSCERSSRSTAGRARRLGQRRRRLEEEGTDTPGFIRRSTVLPITQARYEESARNFEKFVGRELRTLSAQELDPLMVQFMEQLFLAGETTSVARYALYGVAWVCDLITRDIQIFPLAKKTLKGFSRKAPEPSRDPPPLELTWLAADFFERTVGSDESLLAAVATLLAVDGYLRPSEVLALRTQDFFKSGRGRTLKWSVVVAPLSRGVPAKNRQFDDGFVAGAYDRHHVAELISALVSRAPLNTRVLAPLTLPRWEQLCRDFNRSEGARLCPHGLRHTGPSHDFAVHKAGLHDIQLRGRWLATQSCRRYTKPACLHRGLARLSRDQLERAAKAAKEVVPRLLSRLRSRHLDGMSECRRRPLKRRYSYSAVL